MFFFSHLPDNLVIRILYKPAGITFKIFKTMKKFISTIITLSVILLTTSCRQSLDIKDNNEIPANEKNLIMKKDGDSIVSDSTSLLPNPELGDPPPRNGHQW